MERLFKSKGFSMVELIIALVIISIIAAAIYFKWSKSSFDLRSQAELLANDLRYTQNLSMTKNQRFRLVRISATQYQFQDGNSTPFNIPGRTSGGIVTLQNGVTLGAPTITLNAIIFDTKGVPYGNTSGGTIFKLTSTVSFPLSLASESVSVTVAPETGKVSP